MQGGDARASIGAMPGDLVGARVAGLIAQVVVGMIFRRVMG